MALIELIDISKSFDGELVLDEFDLKIAAARPPLCEYWAVLKNLTPAK